MRGWQCPWFTAVRGKRVRPGRETDTQACSRGDGLAHEVRTHPSTRPGNPGISSRQWRSPRRPPHSPRCGLREGATRGGAKIAVRALRSALRRTCHRIHRQPIFSSVRIWPVARQSACRQEAMPRARRLPWSRPAALAAVCRRNRCWTTFAGASCSSRWSGTGPEPLCANRDAEVLAGSVSRLLSSLRTSLADSAECTREHLDVYAAARRARASGPALSVALTPAAATRCSRTRARACRQRAPLWSRQCGSPRRWRRWSSWRCRRALTLARCVGMQPLTHSPQAPVESES